MDSYLAAAAFGAALRNNPAAAAFYDSCTSAQRQDILLQLQQVRDMDAFVQDLPSRPTLR